MCSSWKEIIIKQQNDDVNQIYLSKLMTFVIKKQVDLDLDLQLNGVLILLLMPDGRSKRCRFVGLASH